VNRECGCRDRHSGARISANPESIVPQKYSVKWIPGLRLPRENSFAILSRRRIPE
jgi:hypothetical protein